MKVSLITPTFNSAASIDKNLKSILGQTYQHIQHIIVDNVSQDDTLVKVRSAYQGLNRELKIISEKDKGISDAFNKGILAADGDIIGILNSDDEYYNDTVIELVIKAFEDPSVDFVHGDMLFVDEKYGTNVRHPLLCPLTVAMPYNHPTFFVRKRIYDTVGIFDVSYRYTMDFELICRMYTSAYEPKFRGCYIKSEPLVKMHAGGASWQAELKTLDELERALKLHGFWDDTAERTLRIRSFRIKCKQLLNKLGVASLVKIWRRAKWGASS